MIKKNILAYVSKYFNYFFIQIHQIRRGEDMHNA